MSESETLDLENSEMEPFSPMTRFRTGPQEGVAEVSQGEMLEGMKSWDFGAKYT